VERADVEVGEFRAVRDVHVRIAAAARFSVADVPEQGEPRPGRQRRVQVAGV
jgi:hypothetical protein